MKTLTIALALCAATALPAAAETAPIFAAECMGGVNKGGYNIDTDTSGHLWVNGHRTNLEKRAAGIWEGAYHGAVFGITKSGSDLIVDYTAHHGANGLCVVVAQ